MKKILLLIFLFIFNLYSHAHHSIVSLSPSVTNIIKALGKEDLLVGVSSYCKTSKEVPVVGTALSFNYERALELKTDLVISPTLKSNSDLKEKLKKMKVESLFVDHDSLSGVMESVLMISKALNVEKKGKEIFEKMLKESKKRKRSDLKAIFVVSSDVTNGKIKDLYLAGRKALYGEVLVLAGHDNMAKKFHSGYPQINTEALIELNPDIIFYLSSKEISEKFENALSHLKSISAVKNNRIVRVSGDEFGVPDQNISRLVELLSEVKK